MTNAQKIEAIGYLLGDPGWTTPETAGAYLEMAEKEILNWLYIRSEVPEDAILPSKYDMLQIQACIAGLSISGAEGETHHHENGIVRIFKYPDMLSYIHANVQPYVRVI